MLFMYDNQLQEFGAPFDWACNTSCHFPAYNHCYNHLFFPVKFQIPSCSSPCHFLQLHLPFPSFSESYVPITQWDLHFLEHIVLFHIYESLHVPHSPLLGMEWPCLFLVCLENSLTLFKHFLLRNASLMPSYSCHPSPPLLLFFILVLLLCILHMPLFLNLFSCVVIICVCVYLPCRSMNFWEG